MDFFPNFGEEGNALFGIIKELSRGEICVANLKANGASLDRFYFEF